MFRQLVLLMILVAIHSQSVTASTQQIVECCLVELLKSHLNLAGNTTERRSAWLVSDSTRLVGAFPDIK